MQGCGREPRTLRNRASTRSIGGAERVRLIRSFDDLMNGSIRTSPVFQEECKMITVGMNYHVIPGKQQDFEDKFAAVMGALRAAAGAFFAGAFLVCAETANVIIPTAANKTTKIESCLFIVFVELLKEIMFVPKEGSDASAILNLSELFRQLLFLWFRQKETQCQSERVNHRRNCCRSICQSRCWRAFRHQLCNLRGQQGCCRSDHSSTDVRGKTFARAA